MPITGLPVSIRSTRPRRFNVLCELKGIDATCQFHSGNSSHGSVRCAILFAFGALHTLADLLAGSVRRG